MNDDALTNLRPVLERLPEIANLVLVVAIGLACARLFWLAWPVDHTAGIPTVTVRGNTDVDSANVDIGTITAVNLFGQPRQAQAPAQSRKIITAPETRLDLTLTGVVASDVADSQRSRALIKNAKGEQQPYAVGDVIIDNVKLHAIYPTHVILDRGGRYETLTLEKLKQQDNFQRVASESLPENIGAKLEQVRQKILQHPSTITKYIRLRPAKQNGKLIGYRIYPGPNRRLFQKLGLRPGAIVTKVNGTRLTNSQNAMKALNQLASAPRIRVTLKSPSGRRTISVNFK